MPAASFKISLMKSARFERERERERTRDYTSESEQQQQQQRKILPLCELLFFGRRSEKRRQNENDTTQDHRK